MASSAGNMDDDKKVDILLQRDQTIAEVFNIMIFLLHTSKVKQENKHVTVQ